MSYHQINTDFDQYFDYDHSVVSPLSAQSSDIKPIPSLSQQSTSFATAPYQTSGPTYRYDEHRQTTGMPMGGYANVLAVNQQAGFFRSNNSQFVIPNEITSLPLSNLNDYDFGYTYTNDMDFSQDSQADVPSMFPSTSESNDMSPVIVAPQPQRMYAGIHTKQAAQKLQQASQQASQASSSQAPAGQKPLPTTFPTLVKTEESTSLPSGPQEVISRFLAKMKENVAVSSGILDAQDQEQDELHEDVLSKSQKDEEAMDEDEKLLNSDAGKLLNSKERRQLRNKVSARAFRARRKDYITEIESQLAKAMQDKADLEAQVRQFKEENTRLADLTRMLLSSPSFSGFLRELSQQGEKPGVPHNMKSQQPVPAPQVQQQPPLPKDVSSQVRRPSAQQPQNQTATVGMTLIPETPVDMSFFHQPHQWNSIIPTPTDYQVFSITELPEPPVLDLTGLCEKSGNVLTRLRASNKTLPHLPSSSSKREMHDSDDLFDTPDLASKPTLSLPLSHTLSITLAKATVSAEILQQRIFRGDSERRLSEMCAILDRTCERVRSILP